MSSKPKVSILLPNLNNRPFLDQRIRTVMDQTLPDWELIIVDNYSDDGAWEFFRQCAEKDPRIKISRAPKQGMYANWNNCIRLAKGEYIYIATSDDTMSPNFLEIMVNALDEHPRCGLAHCKLEIIDEKGKPHPNLNWDKFYSTVYFGDLINKKHIRAAPHDGLLHCGVRTVYTSITQLLIRRRLFGEIGSFLTGYGSIADFEWEMRASLVADTVHVPEYLATWRVHREQGTSLDFIDSSQHRQKFLELMDHALNRARKIKPGLLDRIDQKELKYLYTKEKFKAEIKEQKNTICRYMTGLKWLFCGPRILAEFIHWRLDRPGKGKPFISPLEPLDFSRKMITKYGLDKNIIKGESNE